MRERRPGINVVPVNRRLLDVIQRRKRPAHARRARNTVRRNASALLVADRVQRTRCREAESDQSSSTERRLRPFSEWRGTSRLARTALLPSRHFPRIWAGRRSGNSLLLSRLALRHGWPLFGAARRAGGQHIQRTYPPSGLQSSGDRRFYLRLLGSGSCAALAPLRFILAREWRTGHRRRHRILQLATARGKFRGPDASGRASCSRIPADGAKKAGDWLAENCVRRQGYDARARGLQTEAFALGVSISHAAYDRPQGPRPGSCHSVSSAHRRHDDENFLVAFHAERRSEPRPPAKVKDG